MARRAKANRRDKRMLKEYSEVTNIVREKCLRFQKIIIIYDKQNLFSYY